MKPGSAQFQKTKSKEKSTTGTNLQSKNNKKNGGIEKNSAVLAL